MLEMRLRGAEDILSYWNLRKYITDCKSVYLSVELVPLSAIEGREAIPILISMIWSRGGVERCLA